MNILVFDDSEVNREAALAQLQGEGHNVTVVGEYDMAKHLLTPKRDYEKSQEVLRSQFGDFNPWESTDEAKKTEYHKARRLANEQATTYPDFDVVLADFFVPASAEAQNQEGWPFVGQEMPIGVFIALFAAIKGRVKRVALFTDTNHHHHPASACLDPFELPFSVEGARVLFSNSPSYVGWFDQKDLSRCVTYDVLGEKFAGESQKVCDRAMKDSGRYVLAKDWQRLLDTVLAD